ncbi:TonB-dependent receptor [Sphingomonas sp. UYEF23]|uniref:TonB-dependent receptor n=1 Tax=Sphingomonas sp. UYEF23 TaxID=1756408 RepID=UPI0033934204
MRLISISPKLHRTTLLSGAALLALSAAGPALAQVATPSAPAEQPVTSAETAAPNTAGADIVVTARGRAEKLQEVPLAITSISSQALTAANVRNLRDIAYLTPGLQVTSGGSEFGVNPIIRGQTNLNGGSGDPNVAVFFDGIYVSNSSAINLGLIDIERVEVVKGPVSALYGRNAFAGAINYVTKKPSLTEPHATITAFGGNAGQYSVSGSISYPIIKDMLGLRVAGGYEHFDGSYKDSVTGAIAGGFEKRDAQATLYFTPTPALSVTGSYYYGNDTFGESAIAYNVNNCGTRTVPASKFDPGGTGYNTFCGKFDPDAHPVEVPKQPSFGGASGNDRRVNLASLSVTYDFGLFKISSLTGYTKVDQQRLTDFIGRRNGIPFLLTPSNTYVNLLEQFGSNTNNTDFSEEIRIQSDVSKPIRVQAGGFYYNGKTYATTIVGIDGSAIPAGQTLAPANGFGQAVDYVTSNGNFSTTRITQTLSHDKQYSGFVGAEWDLFEGLTASGEYRYTHQKKDQLIIRTTGCPSYLTAPTASCTGPAPTYYLYPNGPVAPSANFNFSNYRGTLKYAISRSSNIYASVANGTKAGGFNQRAVAAPDGSQPDLTFNPEVNTTFEFGSKNSFFNNRLQVNLAVYHIDTKGIQISGPSSVPTNSGLVTKNFGSVHTTGFEAEVAAHPVTGLTLRAGVGYANPKFGKDAFDFGAAAGCASSNVTTGVITPIIPQCAGRVVILPAKSQYNASNFNKAALSLNGLSVPRENNLQVTTGADVAIPIGSGTWKLVGNYSGRYESKNYVFNNNISWYGPRYIVNLRAGFENERYSITAYVNNATDDHTPEIASVNARLSDFGGDLDGYLPIGRQYGLTASAKF